MGVREGGEKQGGWGGVGSCAAVVGAMKLHQIGILSPLEFGTQHEKLARHF